MRDHAFDHYSHRGRIRVCASCAQKEGRAMDKDMSAVYYKMRTADLRELKSKKYIRYEKLERDMGYLAMQEKRKLVQQIRWIDAVLAARGLQLKLTL